MKKKREIAPEFARYLPIRKETWIDKHVYVLLVSIFILSILGMAILPLFQDEICIEGECGFELGCVQDVTIEIANENGVQILQQQCIKEGWTRDTPYYKELKEAGYQRAEVRFD